MVGDRSRQGVHHSRQSDPVHEWTYSTPLPRVRTVGGDRQAVRGYPSFIRESLPELSITPFRGQAALVVPPTSYSGKCMLKNSYGLEAGPYLMTTPHSGIVLGVYNATALAAGIARKRDIFEVTDDSVVLPSFQKCKYCPSTDCADFRRAG